MAIYFSNLGNNRPNSSPFGGFGCLLIALLFFGTGYLVYKFLWYKWTAPALLLIAIAINWKVVAGLGKGLVRLLQNNLLVGLLTVALCVILFPVISLLLVFAAAGGKRVEAMQQDFERQFGVPPMDKSTPVADEEYVEYEEIETRTKGTPEDKPIEPLPLPEKDEKADGKNPYDQMF